MSAARSTSPVQGEVSAEQTEGLASPRPPQNPCMGCEKRHARCHAECEPYLAYWRYNREQDQLRCRKSEVDQIKMAGVMKARAFARRMKGRNG